MSNYLSQMATVAVNHAPVVQPRLASRFEGSAGAAPAEDIQEQVAQPPVHRSATAPAETVTPAKTPRQEQTPAEIPMPVAQPAAPLLQSQSVPPRAPSTEPVTQASPVAEPQQLVQELIRERIHEQPLLVSASAPQGSAPSRSESVILEKHSEHSFFSEIHHEAGAPVAGEQQPATTKSGSRHETPTEPAKAPQIQTRIAAPEPIMQSAMRQPAQTTEVSAPAPSIQVSIGRIEIRANPASSSSTSKPQTPKSATLSLDDYLRQRKGDR